MLVWIGRWGLYGGILLKRVGTSLEGRRLSTPHDDSLHRLYVQQGALVRNNSCWLEKKMTGFGKLIRDLKWMEVALT